jgi:hypothetical protein
MCLATAACLLSANWLIPGMHSCGGGLPHPALLAFQGETGVGHSCIVFHGSTDGGLGPLVGQACHCPTVPRPGENQIPSRPGGTPGTDAHPCLACYYLAQLNADGFQIVMAPSFLVMHDLTVAAPATECPSHVALAPASPRAPPTNFVG